MKKSQLNRKVPLYDLKLPPASLNGATKTLRSGWLSSGENVTRFESELGKRLKVRHTVATNSATSALTAILTALNVAGREVISTPFTFVATTEAILQAGGMPILADIDQQTLNIDPDEVVRKISDRTACVLTVDMAGMPADYGRLVKLADQFELPLVADASHSLGGTYRKKSMAQVADAAVYSFHATKNLVCGEGGLLATKHKILAERVRLLARHGITRTASDRKRGAKARKNAYDVVDLGFKGSMSELHAAVGLGHLTEFDKNQTKRKKLAERYLEHLVRLDEFLDIPQPVKGLESAWHLMIIKLHLSRWKIDRDRFVRLMAENGVECGVHFIPVYQFSFYRQLGFQPEHFPNATYAGQRVVTLPLYPTLKLSDIDYVCQTIKRLACDHSR